MGKVIITKDNIVKGDEFYISPEAMNRFELLLSNKVKCTGVHKTLDIVHFIGECSIGGNLCSGVYLDEGCYKLSKDNE